MKKILFLLLLSVAMYGQVPADATPLENIQITNNIQDNAATKVTVQDDDGVQNWLPMANLPVSTATTNALDLKTTLSAGAFSGFAVTNNGDGTISVGSGIAYLRATNDQYAPLIKYPIAAYNNIPLVDNLNNYIVVSYNGGSPALVLNTTGTGIDTQTNSIAIAAARVGTTVHYVSLVGSNSDPNAKLRNRYLQSEGIRRVAGLAISATGRKIATTAGITYSGLIRLDVAVMNTNVADTYTLAYNNGSTWTRVTGQTDINNTQYNNAGTLTALSNNNFRTDYIYALVNSPSKLYVILGNTQYNTIGAARLAPTPSSLPVELEQLGVLVGRAIIEKDAVTMEMASPFVQDFAAGAIENHNDLAGLQGGTAGEYNHLTNAQVALVNGSEQTANKSSSYTVSSTTTYPNTKALVDGLLIKQDVLTNPITGSGTINTIPLFSTSTGLGNSFLTQNSEGMKIGSLRTTFGVGLSVSQYSTVMNRHIFDDYSLFNPTVGGSGFGAFDASTELMGTVDNAHFMSFQSRLKYTSSGNLTDSFGLTGMIVLNSHEGAGTVGVAHGVLINDVGGAGVVTDNYGIKIENIQRGSGTNWSIFTDGGDSRFKGDIYNLNGKGFFSYSQGDKFSTDKKYTALVNDGKSVWYSIGQGAYTPSNFVMRTFDGTTLLDRFEIDAATGNIGIGTSPGSFKVDVLGGDNNGYKYRGSSGVEAILGVSPTTAQIGSFSNHPVQIVVNSTAVASYDSAGDFVVTGNITANNYSGGATLTGTPTAPTAAPGSTGTQIANLDFVNTAITGSFVDLTTNQTVAGVKTFNNTGSSGVLNGLILLNNGTSTSRSLQITNASSAIGTFNNNLSSGVSNWTQNGSSGIGVFVENQGASSGNGIVSAGLTGSTGYVYVGKNQGTNTFAVTKEGTLMLGTYTVATLPTPTTTAYATATDVLAPTYLGTAVGGGTVVTPVFYNGTTWVCH